MAIKILDPSVVGRIAAGEVVERPASVAKELIENSIDAGATAITVEIRGGGIEYLRVTDNGCGIEPGQVALAFENHATSKLKTAEELDDIRTLGFRGEALPSIAAVSHVELTTRRKNAASGVKLIIDGGVKRPVEETGSPEGTTVVVRELFYNVPVRRAFLKRPNYEGSLVNDLVARMILGNPGVSFRFINNSKTVYHSFGDGNLRHAVFAVYGSETAEKMLELDSAYGGMRISGMIGIGEIAKATRAHQSFYINGRTVRCALITQVLEQVCKGRVTIGTYPMCALSLSIPPASVDVNVHPNKLEVRFRDETSVRLSAENILSQVFETEKMLEFNAPETKTVAQNISVTHKETMVETKQTIVSNEVRDNKPKYEDVMPTAAKSEKAVVTVEQRIRTSSDEKMNVREDAGSDIPNLAEMVRRHRQEDAENASKKEIKKLFSDNMKAEAERISKTITASKPNIEQSYPDKKTQENTVQLVIEAVANTPQTPVFRVIGTLFNTYIMVEIEDAMIMIDQHAAHERLMYERFTQRLYSGESASQTLLVPLIISVSPKEMSLIMDSKEELARAGYDIEQFGDRSISLRSVPFIMGIADAKPSFMSIIGSLDRIESATREARANEIAVMACKAAVKAGDKLTDNEIESLISQMLETGASPTCPHGRPVSRKMTRREIEKLFKRIQ